LASSHPAERRNRVLKHEDSFALLDSYGECDGHVGSEEGFYHRGTRHLSQIEFGMAAQRPLLLNSSINENDLLLKVDLTNAGTSALPMGVIHVCREILVSENGMFEKMRIQNFANKKVILPLSFTFNADFQDIFEIRGHIRLKRGVLHAPKWVNEKLILSYEGLDLISRTTRISYFQIGSFKMEERPHGLRMELTLEANEGAELYLNLESLSSDAIQTEIKTDARECFFSTLTGRTDQFKKAIASDCRINSSAAEFNAWVSRSQSDLHLLISQTENGPYPYAGVPWFSTPFGRDGLICSLQTLWINPKIAKGVLGFLAQTQSKILEPARDAEPGKILHELRTGEMANLGEIPFGRYYGSVDSTPLFIAVAGEYLRVTGDLEFIRKIWPNIVAALAWINTFGDADGDGLVEYSRRSGDGLVSQGWKDSHDSVFHSNGEGATAPVALCEVQGYVYMAKTNAAYMSEKLGDPILSQSLSQEAEALKKNFNRIFWSDQIQTFAMALDGAKKRCEVRSSNVGHCFFTGIIDEPLAARAAEQLMNESSFCGWGLRTIGASEARFNPMSYHNGSVWPHDTSIAAMGLARYGRKDLAVQLTSGLMMASKFVDMNRMPELFCGFARNPGQGPTIYPLSCAPQAWAAGSVFLALQACLGLTVNADEKRITFHNAMLPNEINFLSLKSLALGEFGSADIELIRHANDIGVRVIRSTGGISIAVHNDFGPAEKA
jgi:glycogen debranching enzyme